MIIYLLLGIGVLAILAGGASYIRNANREQIATLIIVVGTLITSFLVFILAITGRLPAIFGIGAAMWPLIYSIWKSYQQVKAEEKVYAHLSSLNNTMARAEALAVLGLKGTPDEPAIRAAHRRLMLRLHPDTEGSQWLAQKINMARDVLLRDLGV